MREIGKFWNWEILELEDNGNVEHTFDSSIIWKCLVLYV